MAFMLSEIGEVMMEAGRELDALVAEKIFGFVLRDTFTGEETPISGVHVMLRAAELERVPRFSTDIAAAWTVVEKMKGLMPANHYLSLTWDKTWKAEFVEYDYDVYPREDIVESDTAPLAICLAALKACGVEI